MNVLPDQIVRLQFEADPSALSAPFTYDPALTGMSAALAILGCFTYLHLTARGETGSELVGLVWRTVGAAILGLTAWAAQFTGMLAFTSPLLHGHDYVAAGAAAGVALVSGVVSGVIVGRRPTLWAALIIGLIVATGMVGLHIWGTTGVYLDAVISVRPIGLGLAALGSFLLAVIVVLTTPTLTGWGVRMALATGMALAMAGLQTLRNAATTISPAPSFLPASTPPETMPIALAVVGGMFVLCLVALFLSTIEGTSPVTQTARPERGKAEPRPPKSKPDAPGGDVGAHIIQIPPPARSGSRARRMTSPSPD